MERISKITLVIAVTLGITLLINGLTALWAKEWKTLGYSVLGMVTLSLPFFVFYLAQRINLKLPPGFLLSGVIFIFLAQYFGELKSFYEKLWWWDIFLHGLFGALSVLFALYIFRSHFRAGDKISPSRFRFFLALSSLCFSITASTLWEIFEFIGDTLLPVKMVKGGLEDSMTDLISGALLALITAVSYILVGMTGANEENSS